MFTGIIEEKGQIKNISISGPSGSIAIKAKKVLKDAKVGDSIAVNGACLTVTTLLPDGFCADVMAETLRKTGFSQLSAGSYVNLERAMAAEGRFGGHIVSGHIEGTGKILSMWQEGNATWVKISADGSLLRYIVSRGSITIDGMSLTVADVDETSFSVSIIPHTAANTTILSHKEGDIVNLETDIIAKYIEKLLASPIPDEKKPAGGITMEDLISGGF